MSAQDLQSLPCIDGLLPVAFLFVDATQRVQRLHLVSRTLRQAREQVLRPIEQTCCQVILRERVQCLVALFGGKVRSRNDVLVDTNRSIDFAAQVGS